MTVRVRTQSIYDIRHTVVVYIRTRVKTHKGKNAQKIGVKTHKK